MRRARTRRREQTAPPPAPSTSPSAPFFHEETPEEREERLYKARMKRKRKKAGSLIKVFAVLILIVLFSGLDFDSKKVLIVLIFFVCGVYVALEAIKTLDGFFLTAVKVLAVIQAIYTFLPGVIAMDVPETAAYTMGHEDDALHTWWRRVSNYSQVPVTLDNGVTILYKSNRWRQWEEVYDSRHNRIFGDAEKEAIREGQTRRNEMWKLLFPDTTQDD